jgi:hypothetical protein
MHVLSSSLYSTFEKAVTFRFIELIAGEKLARPVVNVFKLLFFVTDASLCTWKVFLN